MGELFQMLPYEKERSFSANLEEKDKEIERLTRENLGLEKIVDGYRTFTGDSSSPAYVSQSDLLYRTPETPAEQQLPLTSSDGADSGDAKIDEHLNLTEHSRLSRDPGSKSGESGNEPASNDGAPSLGF